MSGIIKHNKSWLLCERTSDTRKRQRGPRKSRRRDKVQFPGNQDEEKASNKLVKNLDDGIKNSRAESKRQD